MCECVWVLLRFLCVSHALSFSLAVARPSYHYITFTWSINGVFRSLVFWSLFGARASNRTQSVFFLVVRSTGWFSLNFYVLLHIMRTPMARILLISFRSGFFHAHYTAKMRSNSSHSLESARKKRPAQNSIGYVRSFIVSVVRFCVRCTQFDWFMRQIRCGN